MSWVAWPRGCTLKTKGSLGKITQIIFVKWLVWVLGPSKRGEKMNQCSKTCFEGRVLLCILLLPTPTPPQGPIPSRPERGQSPCPTVRFQAATVPRDPNKTSRNFRA